jgi:hypothetical protein
VVILFSFYAILHSSTPGTLFFKRI